MVGFLISVNSFTMLQKVFCEFLILLFFLFLLFLYMITSNLKWFGLNVYVCCRRVVKLARVSKLAILAIFAWNLAQTRLLYFSPLLLYTGVGLLVIVQDTFDFGEEAFAFWVEETARGAVCAFSVDLKSANRGFWTVNKFLAGL